MTRHIFTEGEVETALCLWEAYIELQMGEHGKIPNDEADAFTELRSEHGSYVMRAVMRDLVADCDKAFEAAKALGAPEADCFDFEFCPAFLRGAMDSGLLSQKIEAQYQPR